MIKSKRKKGKKKKRKEKEKASKAEINRGPEQHCYLEICYPLLLLLIIIGASLSLKSLSQEMAKAGTKLPSFCLINRIRPHARVRSPPVQSKPGNVMSSNKPDKKSESPGTFKEEKSGDGVKPGLVISRRIMVVVDSSLEAKGALQWALSHTVQIEDTVILLCVTKPSKQGTSQGSSKKIVPRSYEFIDSLRKLCQSKKPEVKLEVAAVEGKEKGPAIVEEARKQGVAMLVLGQKKRSTTWGLMMMWAGKRVAGGVVEYCIHNADCLAIAVRRKSKKLGGYLITTKRQKDFWLLA